MNIYFVFEGKTEPIVYKNWLAHLVPQLIGVESYRAVASNNYHYESDMGVPDCFNVACNAIQEINIHPVFDLLVLVIDSDRMLVDERRKSAETAIHERLKEARFQFKSLPSNCKLEILVQRVCIETWFLGNRKFFVQNPQNPRLLQFIRFYNVSLDNPEEMAARYRGVERPAKYIFDYPTIALFHEGYLREVFKERRTPYLKARPHVVKEISYLGELIKRSSDQSTHLRSFQEFLQFCSRLKALLHQA